MRLKKRSVMSVAALTFAGGVMLTGSVVTADAAPSAGPVAGPALATSVHTLGANEMVVCRGVLSGSGMFSPTATGNGTGPAGIGGTASVSLVPGAKAVTSGSVGAGGSGPVSVGPDGKIVSSGNVAPPLPGLGSRFKPVAVIVGTDGKVTSSDPRVVVREGTAVECAAPVNP